MSESTEYCDLVMKGGITSGIVYPNAVLALARRYRFKNIGGTSAGAIAAAASAAAALGERRKVLRGISTEPTSGFAGLATVAETLKCRRFIYSLFQPAAHGRAAFRLLVTLAARPKLVAMLIALLRGIVTIAPLELLLTLFLFLGIAFAVAGVPGALAAVFPALICAIAAGAIASVLRFARVVRHNHLGLCSGIKTDASKKTPPALTEWLHDTIQALSGQEGRPLLFADLWEAPRYEAEPVTDKTLTLAMITTGVSHHEPRSLPFEGSRFWFRADEFEALFPKTVVDWMVEQDPAPLSVAGVVYHRLPKGGQLPVIVATRMSLSFPILISAVPLHEGGNWAKSRGADIDTALADTGGETSVQVASEMLTTGGRGGSRLPNSLRKCWFSDGGIASNFPLHLFDAALPRWPTFAIDLTYREGNDYSGNPAIFLPSENNQGWQRRYSSFAAKPALGELAKFLFAIIGTMQNWRDLLQSRAPGHRDRIVHVALDHDEGGMNLDMDQDVLDRIAAKGTAAGEVLIAKFDFNNHWWVRWRNVASSMERFTIDLARGAGPPISDSYADAHTSALSGVPLPPSYPFTAAQQRDAQARLATMIEQGELWADADPDLTQKAPRPLPQLRVTPTF